MIPEDPAIAGEEAASPDGPTVDPPDALTAAVAELPLAAARPDPAEHRRRRRELPLVVAAAGALHLVLLAGLRAVIVGEVAPPAAVPVMLVQLPDAAADGLARAAALLPARVAAVDIPAIAAPEPLAVVAPPAGGSTGLPPGVALAPGGGGGGDDTGEIVMPVPIDTPRPAPTDEAVAAGFDGVAALEIVVDTRGDVVAVQVLEPLPHGLAAPAVETVKRWTFEPALFRGQPIELAIKVTVRFGTAAAGARGE